MPNLVAVDPRAKVTLRLFPNIHLPRKYLLRIQLPKGLKSIGQRALVDAVACAVRLECQRSDCHRIWARLWDVTTLRYVVATGNKITTLGDSLFGESDGRNKLIYK